jgi:hypothetical protein
VVKWWRMRETLPVLLLLVSLGPAVHAQEAVTDTECSVRGFFHETWGETSQFGHGPFRVSRIQADRRRVIRAIASSTLQLAAAIPSSFRLLGVRGPPIGISVSTKAAFLWFAGS